MVIVSKLRTAASMLDASSPRALMDSLRFVGLFPRVRDYTMVSPPRLRTLHRLCSEIERKGLPGDIVECGVCNGGTAATMAAAIRGGSRRMWLFDSFQGLPEPGDLDGDKAHREYFVGMDLGSIPRVKEALAAVSFPEDRVNIVPGWFEDTLPHARVDQIALMHVDADWFDSVKLVLDTFYDSVVPGGYIVFDDYGHWEGCEKAVQDFLQRRKLSVEIRHSDYTGVYFQKPAAH
jgi:O-methyltransferase